MALNSLLSNLKNVEPNSVVYIAIGSAAGTKVYDVTTKRWILPEKLQQQYPPFLKDIKMNNFGVPVHIFLIDPLQELPPFVASSDKVCQNDTWTISKQLDEGWSVDQFDPRIYRNIETNLNVYCLKENVSYCSDNHDQCVVIDQFFDKVVENAIKFNWFVVFYDFAGKNVTSIASKYDAILGNHLSHVFFGLGARKDGGCLIDICEPICNFGFNFTENGITAYNPYLYQNQMDKLLQDYKKWHAIVPENKVTCIFEQLKQFIDTKIANIKNCLNLLRCIKSNKEGKNVHIDYTAATYLLHCKHVDIVSKCDRNEYDELICIITSIIKIDIENLFVILPTCDYIKCSDDFVSFIEMNFDTHNWSTVFGNLVKAEFGKYDFMGLFKWNELID